ncbi:MAG: Rieske 2Fe-2S domain-containing protein [Nitrososphaerales archaeon]
MSEEKEEKPIKPPVKPPTPISTKPVTPTPTTIQKIAKTIPPPKPVQPLPIVKPLPRRDFIKYASIAGGILSIIPFIPFGSFFTYRGVLKEEAQKIILADGNFANIKTFPVNSSATFPYPRTGDPVRDSEPFRQFVLIRLPKELGGDREEISSFRAYSNICVHLWCLWRYSPQYKNLQCPCHASIYRVEDGLAIKGPAALQTPPQNALPMLELDVDDKGFILVKPPVWDVNGNGVVGFGRYIKRK